MTDTGYIVELNDTSNMVTLWYGLEIIENYWIDSLTSAMLFDEGVRNLIGEWISAKYITFEEVQMLHTSNKQYRILNYGEDSDASSLHTYF